jgi:putative glutathione S-transferase
MGQLVAGEWLGGDQLQGASGRYERTPSVFIGRLSGAAPLERRRYVLFMSRACPWAHRVLLTRALCGLEPLLPVVELSPELGAEGWSLAPGQSPLTEGASWLHTLYTHSCAEYTGRVTLPLLWDVEQGCVVSNDSAELMRFLQASAAASPTAFGRPVDLSPAHLHDELAPLCAWLQSDVNNAPYRAGFARTQALYEEAVFALFDSLDILDHRLASRRFLCGEALTEADVRLFPTLIRFDVAYYSHFKCNLRRLADYPHLARYLRELYRQSRVPKTVDLVAIKRHYFRSVPKNDHIPLGPLMEL